MDRRNFLKFSLATGALAASTDTPFAQEETRPRSKAVIWLWMGGGMSQIDTFDPKPGTKEGGEFKSIQTSVPGIELTEHLPLCASQMKHLAVIRSMQTHEGDHGRATYLMHTGMRPGSGYELPSVGTIVSYELGQPGFLLPKFIAIDPPALPLTTVFPEEDRPFQLKQLDPPIPNLVSPVAEKRDAERAALLSEQDREWNALHQQEIISKYLAARSRAELLRTSPLLRAFDCSREPEALLRDYGNRFGLNCLLARRLVQAGCSFIEIGMGGWDIRDDLFNSLKRMLQVLDRGLGTLIKDLAEKDLLKSTLVVLATEFGRTPDINAGKGRDHHANGFSVVLAGSRIRGGQVYGKTGDHGEECQNPVSAQDFLATVYAACGIDPLRLYDTRDRKIRYLPVGARPIRALLA